MMIMRVKLTDGQITDAANGETGGNGGWIEARPTARPEDTDEGTWTEGVDVVDGQPVQTWMLRPWTAAELASVSPERLARLRAAGRAQQLRELARQALTVNGAYLALSPPTAAQLAAQVNALTRQVNVLIKLGLGLLDED